MQHGVYLNSKMRFCTKQCNGYTVPCVNTLKQTSQTRTGLTMLYLMIGISFSEHLEHRIRPQCRLYSKQHQDSTHYIHILADLLRNFATLSVTIKITFQKPGHVQ